MNLSSKTHGFTLLENLAALLILSIGLLGIAGLQAFTLKSGTSSAMRLTAIQQANEIADRIRANIAGVYPPPGSLRLYNDISPANPPATSKDCSTAKCTPSELEAYDLRQWYDANLQLFPGDPLFAGGYIVRLDMADAAGNAILLYPTNGVIAGPPRARFQITMRWDAERTGATGINCPPQSDADMRCYILEIDL